MTISPPCDDLLPLPVSPDGVTAAWLTAALRQRRPGIAVRSCEIVDVMTGTSTKIRVRLTCSGPGAAEMPATLIVKGGFEQHSRNMGPMYANEARFYADVQPNMPMPSPHCYFAASDPSSHQSIVIMEDLRRPGVEFCDPLRPQGFEQVARRMDAMARYHAATWQSPEFAPGGRWADIGSRFETWGLEFMGRFLVPAVWDSYMAAPRGAAASVLWHDREWMQRALQEIGRIQFEQPRCLIHGDTHLGNLYILEDGAPGFFDAQVARTAWHHEVSYHIVCALDPADRAAWEGALLERYLGGLRAHGIDAPPYEAAWLDYRRSIVWGLFIFLTNPTLYQSEAVNTAYAARFSQAALDHELKRLLA